MSAEYLNLCRAAEERNLREGRPVTALLWKNEAYRNNGEPEAPREERARPLVRVTEQYTKES